MTKQNLKFYVKERRNPQLGTYFQIIGWLSKTAAKRLEKCIYGQNIMHGFDTHAEAVEFQRKHSNDLK